MSDLKPIEAEAVLLGALLDADGALLGSTASELAETCGLGAEDFTDPRARLYWQSAVRLSEHKRPVDAVTVWAAAKLSGQVSDADLVWLQGLQARNSLNKARFIQVAESFRHDARGMATATRLEMLAQELRARRQGPSQISGQLEALASMLTSQWAPDQSADGDVVEILSEWDYAGEAGGRPMVVPTGITAVDEVMRGWKPNLNLIIGQPSAGKSAFSASSIVAQIRAGIRPGIFGLEDGTRWLMRRLMAQELKIPVGDIARFPLTVEQRERIAEFTPEWIRLAKELTTFKFSSIGVTELCRRSVHWIKNRGVGAIWVDHGGLIEHEKSHGEDNRTALGKTLFKVRAVGEKNNVPMVVLMHTSRPDPKDREERPPKMTEIAESAYAERHAFKILGLWLKDGELRATILKDKEGRRDVTIALQRVAEAAMVHATEGEVVDLNKERSMARQSREAEKQAQMRAARDARYKEAQERKRLAAEAKAAAAPKPGEQANLLLTGTR